MKIFRFFSFSKSTSYSRFQTTEEEIEELKKFEFDDF